MRKTIGTIAALSALSFAAFVPVAEARSAHWNGGRGHYAHNGYRGGYHGGYHRGRGYWRNGQWIALGVGAAVVGAAAASANGCYWRNGYRYCN